MSNAYGIIVNTSVVAAVTKIDFQEYFFFVFGARHEEKRDMAEVMKAVESLTMVFRGISRMHLRIWYKMNTIECQVKEIDW